MTTEPINADYLTSSEIHHPFAEDERIEMPPEPAAYRRGTCLILENGAVLPSHVCLKSGFTAKRGVKVSLCSPFNPLTWIRGGERITIGLSYKHFENHRIRRAFAWSLICLGVIMIALGFAPGSSTAIAGIFCCLSGGAVRAAFPIWVSFEGSNRVVIHGCGERFLELFPAVND